MKNSIIGSMCFIFLLSANLTAKPVETGYTSDICTGCDQDFQVDISTYIHYKMIEIHQILINYELEGSDHKLGFDYHVGYLNGQYSAYKNLENRFNQP